MTLRIRDASAGEPALFAQTVLEGGAYSGPARDDLLACSFGAVPRRTSGTRVATLRGQVAGFYRLLLPDAVGLSDGELDYVFVQERWRGLGVGAALVRDARRIAGQVGAGSIRIVAHPPLEPFYRRVGALRTGTEAGTAERPWSCPVLTLPATSSSRVRQLLTVDT